MKTVSRHSDDALKGDFRLLIPFALNFLACCAAIVWLAWPSLLRMQATWSALPQYSHGYLVPLFAAYVLWHRRGELFDGELRPSLWGLPVLAAGLALKWAGAAYYVDYLDDVSIVVLLLGGVLTVGGPRGLAWSWPGLLFLGFMIPLPFRVETALQQTLLQWATVGSTYGLQTLGYAAFAEGNLIHLPKSELGVLDACSGLRMVIVCTAMATLAAFVSTAPIPQRVVVLLSGIPLALVTNIMRIVTMGMISEAYGQETAERLFHDVSGLAMILVALVGLAAEMRLLDWIYDIPLDDEHHKPMFAQPAA